MIIVGDRTFVGEVDWRGFGLWFRAEAMSLYDNALEIINTAIPTQVARKTMKNSTVPSGQALAAHHCLHFGLSDGIRPVISRVFNEAKT